MDNPDLNTRRRLEEMEALEERLRQLFEDFKSCDESQLGEIIREFKESTEGRRFRGVEAVAEDIRECYCAEKTCGHTCTSWACTNPCEVKEPGYCEDCFAFVPNLLTFCHCGQIIMASWSLDYLSGSRVP